MHLCLLPRATSSEYERNHTALNNRALGNYNYNEREFNLHSAKLVSELMTTSVKTVTHSDNLDVACQLMADNKISCVVVVSSDDPDQPIGIITERRIVVFLSEHPTMDPAHVSISELIGPHLYTTHQDESLINAMASCRDLHIRHLVVTDSNKKLVGVISYTDIVDETFGDISKHIALTREHGSEQSNKSLSDIMQELALKDPMTNVGNRRSMDLDLSHTWQLANRYSRHFCLALIDIDLFKKYNDTYGHLAGDEALIAVVDIIRENIRVTDRLYRYGGEEFLLLLPETSMSDAEKLGERVTKAVKDANLPHESSPYGTITVSSGIAGTEIAVEDDIRCERELIERADRALYVAKASGRNKRCVYVPHRKLENTG